MTSRNYLFNSIKENIRRNFYLLILLSVSMLAVLPAYTIMQMELAPLQYPAMGSSLNSSQEMLLKCLDSTNPGVQIVVIGAAVLLAMTGFSYLHAGKKTDFYHSLPLKREELFMVSVYVAYHLKSGRTVYRAYMIPETEEVISQITAVYDDWSYREKMLPTSYQKAEDIDYLYLDTFYESRKQISGGRSELEEIYKTYKTELENMSFQESCENRVVGYLITEKEWKDYGNDTYTTSYSLPIYENFTKTMGLLKEAGEEVLVTIDSEQVEALTLSFWNEEQEKTVEIKDNAQIETLSEHLTYEDCRYGVDSRVEYDIMVNILWKNREYSSPNVYLMGDESVEDILKNLNFD